MITMPINSWSNFKTTIVTDKGLGLQFTESSDRYEVYAADVGIFLWNICLLKDGGADVTDFETNYKNNANKSLTSVISPRPPIDNTISGTFTGANQTLQISTIGCSTAQYGSVDHSWSGTIITELSYDNGVNWFSCATADTDPSTNLLMLEWGNSFVPAFNTDPWEVNVSGSTLFRLRVEDYASGSIDLIVVTSAASTDVATPSNDRWISNGIDALHGEVSGPTSGCSSVSVGIIGTWVGALGIKASNDNVNFFVVPFLDVSTGFQVTSITANGNFIVPCGGFNAVKVVMNAYTSGTAIVTLDAGEGSNSGVFVIDPPVKYSNLTGNATTTVKSGAGRLHSITINNNTTGGTITVYDNTAASGTKIATMVIGTPSGGLLSTSGQSGPITIGPVGPNGIPFATGITIVTAGSTSNNITVVYQ